MAAAGEAQVLADGLAGDNRPGVERPGDDGGVAAWHVALNRDRAVHHLQAGDLDVVLDRDPAARQRPVVAGADLTGDIPSPEVVVRSAGPLPGAFRRFGQ